MEHIVPESLGNDLLVLGRGWVCDKCNNMHSAFETRAVAQSILGVERCILKVVTKKGKPSRSRVHGITWFAEPDAVPGVVVAEADWSKVLVLTDEAGQCGMAVFPVHDRSCDDIARLLLKMGIELLAVVMSAESQETRWNLSEAKDCVLGRSSAPWPYFLLRSPEVVCHFTSILAGCPDEHEYIRSCGFDLFLHIVNEEPIVVFSYGRFLAAIALQSRDIAWSRAITEWGCELVGCPHVFEHLSWTK